MNAEGDESQQRRRISSVGDDSVRNEPVSKHDTTTAISNSVLTAAPTALPSVLARVTAFVAIVIAAVCGGLAGYAMGSFQCSTGCVGPTLGGAAIGALIAASGIAALAALVLRSMSEWADQASVSQRRHSSRRKSGPTDARFPDKAVRQ